MRGRHGRRTFAATTIALAAAVVAAGCGSTSGERLERQPYRVVLLPVEGADEALAASPEADEFGGARVALAMTPDELEQTIFDGVRDSGVFSDLVVADRAMLGGGGLDEELAAASDIARREGADLVLRVTVKSAKMSDLGNNGSTIWSTVTWFMVPLPIWFVDDRTYSTNIAVQAELFEPGDAVKPASTVVASSGTQELDLWDRGLSPFVLVVPPPFLEGSDRAVSEELTERAVAQLMEALVTELRTRPIPSRFDVRVAPQGEDVRIDVVSRRKLRSLEVQADGRRLAAWAETALVEDRESTAERWVYRRSVRVGPAGAARTLVRVLVEDEAGGREVRTLALGDAQ